MGHIGTRKGGWRAGYVPPIAWGKGAMDGAHRHPVRAAAGRVTSHPSRGARARWMGHAVIRGGRLAGGLRPTHRVGQGRDGWGTLAPGAGEGESIRPTHRVGQGRDGWGTRSSGAGEGESIRPTHRVRQERDGWGTRTSGAGGWRAGYVPPIA